MLRTGTEFAFCVALILVIMLCAACEESGREVTIYVSLDRQLAEPVLAQFASVTDIDVNAVYDTEANKTSGLVNRLISEVPRPRADVYWNNEIAQMYRLSERGVLQSDPREDLNTWEGALVTEADWNGFAARARVFVTRQAVAADDIPRSLGALGDPRWKGEVVIANPRFGTTGTHFAALLTVWGEEAFRQWLRALQENDVAMLPGNAQVKDAVVAGTYTVGLTDTDDVNIGLLDGHPLKIVFPGQKEGALGVFIIPNAVALIRGGPNPTNGQKLVEFLLSPGVERMLAQGDGAQIPIRHDVPGPALLPDFSDLRVMQVDYDEVGRSYERMLQIVDEEWPR